MEKELPPHLGQSLKRDQPESGRFILIAKVSLDRRALGWVLFSGPPGVNQGGWVRVCTIMRRFCTT